MLDQTPTPTRFLRNCEESGLFQELEANPFDQDFKTASDGTSKGQAKASDPEAEGKCEFCQGPIHK